MPTFYLTRREHFNAAHKLYNPQWTAEQNDEVFGKCANENWHGHNFELFVTVKGAPDPDTGFIVDAKLLSKIIKEYVVDVLDHRNLYEIWGQLAPHMPKGVLLHCIKLVETPRIYVEYFGD